MKLATCSIHHNQAPFLGAVVDNLVFDLAKIAEYSGEFLPNNMLEFIQQAPTSMLLANRLIAEYQEENLTPSGAIYYANNATFLAPIPRPQKNIFGIGLNYKKHIEESSRNLDTKNEIPKEPIIFTKPPTTVVGYGDAVEHNSNITKQLDWEVELAVIIGQRGKHIQKKDAMQHVFGYTVILDVSARDCRRAGQWIVSKGQDTFAPMGPQIVTTDDIKDPHCLNLWLKKNGTMKQQDNTQQMIFKIDDLIADISSVMTLEPGDIIATGTPDGVGAGRDPQEWLWPGDYLEYGVEGIGEMYTPITDISHRK